MQAAWKRLGLFEKIGAISSVLGIASSIVGLVPLWSSSAAASSGDSAFLWIVVAALMVYSTFAVSLTTRLFACSGFLRHHNYLNDRRRYLVEAAGYCASVVVGMPLFCGYITAIAVVGTKAFKSAQSMTVDLSSGFLVILLITVIGCTVVASGAVSAILSFFAARIFEAIEPRFHIDEPATATLLS